MNESEQILHFLKNITEETKDMIIVQLLIYPNQRQVIMKHIDEFSKLYYYPLGGGK